MDFAHAMIDGQKSGVTHIPCWLITDIRSFHRYVVGGHLPIPEDPVRAGAHRTEGAQGLAGIRRRQGGQQLGGTGGQDRRAGATQLAADRRRASTSSRARVTTTTSTAATAPTTTTTATRRCPTRTCIRWASRRTTRSRSSSATSGTSGGLRTDEYARVLRADDTRRARPVRGGQHLGGGDGPQLRRRGRDHRPGHDLRLRRRQAHRRPAAETDGTQRFHSIPIGGNQ